MRPLRAMSRRTSTWHWHSGQTGACFRLKIVAPLGTERPQRPTKSEVNRPCRFNLASKKRSSTRQVSIDLTYIFFAVYRTPFTNSTLDFHEIRQACRRRYATHSRQISSKSNLPFVRERKKLAVNRSRFFYRSDVRYYLTPERGSFEF